ncbi:MAG: DPP IV N-terminal domain-containing protein [Acidobacteria bacterium]|nr:DPP IV N-terminal domain-containing protein [Acidobacteriota bacterium]
MMTTNQWNVPRRLAFAVLMGTVVLSAGLVAQDRLKTMPGYEQYLKMAKEMQGAVKTGALNATWIDGGNAFEYPKDGKIWRYDILTKQTTEIGPAPEAPAPGAFGGRGQGGGPARGRQAATADSPDTTLKAFYKDRNLFVSAADGTGETSVTTDGSERDRIKYGTASWVYGEELAQTTAMWWSPDSKKLAYYRFDETKVPDYFLQTDQTALYSTVDTEAYPKAGERNPVVDLFVYDIATRATTKIDVRGGMPFDNDVVGHYVYRISWSPDGKELLLTRANRRQNIQEFVAADPATGACRVILREEWPTGWVSEAPARIFLKDGRRFIWASERTGWRNYYLYDLAGTLITPLTRYTTFEAADIVKIDEDGKAVFLMARDGDNYLKQQLHRVSLDGRSDVRLTDPAFHHAIGSCMPFDRGASGPPRGGPGGRPAPCGVSPDSRFAIDVYQTHDKAPATRLLDALTGKTVTELAASDLTKFDQLGLKKAEMFTYTAADGRTPLRGLISFPSNFTPSKKYPTIVAVYGGPEFSSNTARESFVPPNPMTEYGFLVVNLDSRAAPGMGKRSLDAVYLKLGQVEMDDMAAGIKSLWSRPYFDKDRVGIYGTSYGGYSSVMSLLRHPEAFRAASASSAVTAWIHYDTIYTERYMWIPQENKEGYELGSAMKYADKLDGRLLLYYGTADNNVHPTNAMQLIQALQHAGKSFEVQVGPDAGHSGVNPQHMMEFFIENLVIDPPKPAAAPTSAPAPPKQGV